MRTLKMIVVWVVCVVVGAGIGFLAGWILWKLGFELIGSAVALVGAGLGGIAILIWLMSTDWAERFLGGDSL